MIRQSTTRRVSGRIALRASAAGFLILGLSACAGAGTELVPASADPYPSATVEAVPEVREPLWSFDLGTEGWATATVVGELALIGADDGVMRALDVADGSVAWEVSTGGALRGSAAVDGDAAYVVSDDGNVYAFGLDGDEVWTASLGSAGDPRGTYDNYGSKPAVVDGVVYAAGMAGVVAAIDAATGDVVWTHDVGGAVETGIAVADGRVHVTAMNNRHVALDASSGELLWELNTLDAGTTTPLVMGDRVIIGSRSANVQIRDAATGDKIWTASYGASWVQSGGAALGDDAFAIGSSDLGVVRAYDLATGDVVWNTTLGGWPWAVPAVADGVVYATNIRIDYQLPWDAALHALDAETGAVLWTAAGAPALTWQPDGFDVYGAGAAPAIADDVVIVILLDGTVKAFKR